MRTKSDDFQAGVAAVILFATVASVFNEHGKPGDPAPFSWADVAWVLIILAVLASCVIEIYKYIRRLP